MKSEFKLIVVFSLVFITLSVVALTQTASATPSGTVAKIITHSPTDQDITIAATEAGNITEYTSPAFMTDFVFTGVGIRWTGSSTAQVTFVLKIDDTDWKTLTPMGNEAKDKYEGFVTEPLFQSGHQLQYRITGPDVALVRQVELVYFDASQPPVTSTFQSLQQYVKRAIQNTTSVIPVISRSDWGADESYRTWEPQYTTPTHFIIHHTAGGTGGDDPMATVRGIYYWQAIVLGWGDIGYNYLVDTEGNIYEGRYGGEGVIGAHAYNSITNTNYNENTIGISVLGCYEDTSGACATINSTTLPAITALEQLIGQQAGRWQIDPTGTTTLQNELLPAVIGHQNVDATYCPGDLLYAELDTIRSGSEELYNTLDSYQATWTQATIAKNYTTTAKPNITVMYHNAGSTVWSTNTVAMQVSIPRAHLRQRVPLSADVAIGEDANLVFTWFPLPHAIRRYAVYTKLYHAGARIRGSTHTYHVSITAQ